MMDSIQSPGRARRLLLHPDVFREMKNHPLVLAVSGGADSMALLHMVGRLLRAGRIPGPVLVAHINHQQRQPFANQASAQVEREAARRELPIRTLPFDRLVPSIIPPVGVSLEAWLADHRHRFLAQTAQKLSHDAIILTGHQANDHAESLLLGLMRGNGLAGLSFPVFQTWFGVTVAAPLTLCRRDDIRTWLERQQVPWLEDPMNTDPHSARSTIRMLLQRLEQDTQRNWTDPLVRSAESLRCAGDYLLDQANQILPCLTTSPEGLDVRLWRQQPWILQDLILRQYAQIHNVELSGRKSHELAAWLRTSALRTAVWSTRGRAHPAAEVRKGFLTLKNDPV
jgi:tRNA(Ile)-lysidine synthase